MLCLDTTGAPRQTSARPGRRPSPQCRSLRTTGGRVRTPAPDTARSGKADRQWRYAPAAAVNATAASQAPLFAKHGHQRRLDRRLAGIICATGAQQARCARNRRCVQQRPAGIRIDLDQLRAVRTEMEVVTQEDTRGKRANDGPPPAHRPAPVRDRRALPPTFRAPRSLGAMRSKMFAADEDHAVRKQVRSGRQQFGV
jgi:hypothetical protein